MRSQGGDNESARSWLGAPGTGSASATLAKLVLGVPRRVNPLKSQRTDDINAAVQWLPDRGLAQAIRVDVGGVGVGQAHVAVNDGQRFGQNVFLQFEKEGDL